MRSRVIATGVVAPWLLVSAIASSQEAPTGAPPPEATAVVEAPKAAAEAPKMESPKRETTASVSAGGQLSTGNSQLLAGTGNGKFDMRRGSDGFGASLLGNYGQGAPGGQQQRLTTENVQGRVRYDRYLADRFSLFMMATGRFDHFQGLDFRLNLDPGGKYLFVNTDPTSLWGELGYDFQYDIRNNSARVQLDATGNPIAGAPLLDKTAPDHSGRLFMGFKHAFNKEVTLSTGIEYLQSFADANRYRINYDALFASGIGGGVAVGFGFSARFDHAPLPGKEKTDTATTFSLIYAYSDVPEAPAMPAH
jgi:putative salt-induced outer membrane protein